MSVDSSGNISLKLFEPCLDASVDSRIAVADNNAADELIIGFQRHINGLTRNLSHFCSDLFSRRIRKRHRRGYSNIRYTELFVIQPCEVCQYPLKVGQPVVFGKNAQKVHYKLMHLSVKDLFYKCRLFFNRDCRSTQQLYKVRLGGTILTYLLTRNVTKMLAVLMVDFSCALKLSMPIAVLSAMRECSNYKISVKGGKFLEAVSEADTIVFDKTGTLTYAAPTVEKVIPFGNRDADEMLRLAACLEEHYPHSMANAVVAAAKEKGLSHEEYHSSVEYVVAHGISSTVENEKVIIGSAHFVFEDEGCVVPEGDEELFNSLSGEYSHLYLAVSGVLAAVICISDPLRAEAADAIKALHNCGISKIVMMTGDNEQTAKAVAAKVGVDEFHAGVLPEDKANFIKREHEKGRKVIMIGDGVNDSPALSEADAGIAINTGAAIAKEIADITVSSEDLYMLVTLRKISSALMKRIHHNYRFIVSFNLMLILLGVGGIIQPTTSALFHNASTLAISLKSMTNLLDEEEK